MTAHLLASLSQWIISVISHLGYGGIVLLMTVESACIPLPSEVILPFSGYLVYTGRFELAGVTLAGALGCNLGSIIAWAVGFYGGRPLAQKYGRWVLLSPRDLERAEHWFARHGDGAVFFSRMLPVVRTFIALPAGVARMRFIRFNIYTFLGSLPWCWLLAWAGYRLGQNWDALRVYFHRFDLLIGLVLLAGVGVFIWHHLREWKSSAASQRS